MENDAGRDAEIVLRFAVRCGFREARQKIFNLRGTPGQTVKERPSSECVANHLKEALAAVRAALAKGHSAEEFKNEPELRSLQSLPEFQRLLTEADSKKK
jgi:hypothetical protein